MNDQKDHGAELAADDDDTTVVHAPERQAPDVHANCKAELDRMRLLLRRATGKSKAYRIEMEPAANGFAIVVTGVTAEDEWQFASEVAQYLKVMFEGALRFMHAYSMMTADERAVAGAAKFRAELIDTQAPEAEGGNDDQSLSEASGSVPSAAK